MENLFLLKSFQYKMFLSNAKFCDFDQMYGLYKERILKKNCTQSRFVSDELQKISETDIDLNFLKLYDDEQYLDMVVENIFSAINNYFDINLSTPVFIVDTFPGNFALDSWKALSVDSVQAQYYSINEGIYFKKEFVSPYLFEILLCHEIIHQVLPVVSKHFAHLKSSLDEEGICDFFAYFILLEYSIIKDDKFIERFLTFNRGLSSNVNYIRYSYWNASFRASLLYSKYGKADFLERYIYQGQSLDVLKFDIDSNYDECLVSNKIKNIFIKVSTILTLTEKEFVVFKNAYQHSSLGCLSKELGCTYEETVSLCKALQNKWLIFIQENAINSTLTSDEMVYYYLV